MRILIVSKDGDTAPLAQRLLAEGHTTRVLITKAKEATAGNGLWPKLAGEAEIEAFAPDLIVNLETSLPGFAEHYAKLGYTVLGGSKLAVQLEADRKGALEFAAEAGILTPHTVAFDDAVDAIRELRHSQLRYVCKFNEDGGDKFLSFMGQSASDTEHFIRTKYRPEKHKGLILQEFIDGPAECNCEAWFSGGELIWPMNGGMEQKRFLSGDLGPNTGCMSTLTWPLGREAMTPWTSAMLEKLREFRYTGPLDMAFKVSKDHKFYFLEFTPRAGINAIYGLVDLLTEDLGEFLLATAKGEAREMQLRKSYAFVLTISTYPYPYELPSAHITGVELHVPAMPGGANWWPVGVERSGDRTITSSGYPLVGYISSIDSDAGKAINRGMVLAEQLKVTGKQYRDDALKLLEPLRLLRSLGLADAGR